MRRPSNMNISTSEFKLESQSEMIGSKSTNMKKKTSLSNKVISKR